MQVTILSYAMPTPDTGCEVQDRVKNVDIADMPGLSNIADIIAKKALSTV